MINGGNSFNGTSDYIRVPTDSSIQFDEDSFTAEAWIYPETSSTSGSRIINNRGTGGTTKGYQLKIAASAGSWKFKDSSIDDAAGSYKAYEGTTTYSFNAWYHVIMVYEADNELRFYVNGVLDGTLSVGSYGNISNSLPTAIGAAIANNGVEGTYAQFFDGGLDEIRLSNITRSSGWITTEYNNQFVPDSFFDIGDVEIVQTSDTIPPEIISLNLVSSTPIDTDPAFGWENITITVTDDVNVDEVKLNITYPDSSTINISMLPLGGNLYYHNTTFTVPGDYSYFVWANDTSDNGNISSVDVVSIPPNWDINVDHDCGVLDLVLVAGHFDETGAPGWIREDVNNDGDISIFDLVSIANHFDETW
ncbi:LamG-like jellyroll fold domain-containing protein [Thermoplasmatota archaeon]